MRQMLFARVDGMQTDLARARGRMGFFVIGIRPFYLGDSVDMDYVTANFP